MPPHEDDSLAMVLNRKSAILTEMEREEREFERRRTEIEKGLIAVERKELLHRETQRFEKLEILKKNRNEHYDKLRKLTERISQLEDELQLERNGFADQEDIWEKEIEELGSYITRMRSDLNLRMERLGLSDPMLTSSMSLDSDFSGHEFGSPKALGGYLYPALHSKSSAETLLATAPIDEDTVDGILNRDLDDDITILEKRRGSTNTVTEVEGAECDQTIPLEDLEPVDCSKNRTTGQPDGGHKPTDEELVDLAGQFSSLGKDQSKEQRSKSTISDPNMRMSEFIKF